MTIPRSRQISLEDTTHYHIVSRCVRRAFLCGQDAASKKSYAHRREWVVAKIAQLSQLFAIGICAYAVMSNHYHIVLRVEPQIAHAWAEGEVVERWGHLFNLPQLIRRWQNQEPLDALEIAELKRLIELWRERLHSISWFVRLLNESIARQANGEDNCKGHFWEGRFKCQALLTENALLACMAYVDLNPVRAAIANTPESSDFTSIKQRIAAQEPLHIAPTEAQIEQ
ncbi:MAG: transposase, partial [Shewanella sp.]|uniref:transposase n=1 Tax=Shewanella sp. TaxID=50422 RepID=UPI003F2FFE95